jgi:hypothetical protein
MPRDDDRTYHGLPHQQTDDGGWGPRHLQIELTAFGPTERETVTVLRTEHELDAGGFGWGYNGGGTSRAAAVILADALDLGDPVAGGIALSSYPEDETFVQLREAFCEDVLSQMCDEFRLRRGAVLRWARGWYAQQGITHVPAAVASLPPVMRSALRGE